MSLSTTGAVFAHSTTPHLVLSAKAEYAVISVNDAFCHWSGCSASSLVQSNGFPSETIANLLNIPASSLVVIIQKVSDTGIAFKRKIEPSGEVVGHLAMQEGYVLEAYPIVKGAVVDEIVISVQPLATIEPLPLNETSPAGASQVDYRLLPLILDSLANVIFVVNVEAKDRYRFSFTNKAFQVTTGLPVDKVVGSLVDEIIPEPSLSLVKSKYAEVIRTGKQVSWEEVSEYPTGTKTGQVVTVPILGPDGKCDRLIGMVHDVTEFKMVEEQQKRLSQELSQQNKDLQQFNYIVSHNLRAPVANALGLCHLLTEKPKNSKGFDNALHYLYESVRRMDDILLDLTQILSIKDKNDLIIENDIALEEVFKEAMFDLRGPLEQSGAEVISELEPGTLVQGYKAYLHSVFYNLFSNAIKYRSENRPLKISVKAEKTPQDCVKVTFTDNGTGFDLSKAQDKVFRLYKRFHHDNVGKGIGLYLVKTQVEAMGGKIKVDSEIDKGTTFKILLAKDRKVETSLA